MFLKQKIICLFKFHNPSALCYIGIEHLLGKMIAQPHLGMIELDIYRVSMIKQIVRNSIWELKLI